MEDKELFNPQTGEKIAPKRSKKFYKDWRFYVYSLIALMLAIVSISSAVTACAAINAGVGQNEHASYSVAEKKNAAITTDGGFSGYRFSVSSGYAVKDIQDLGFYWFLYDVNASFTLTEYSSGSLTIGAGYTNIVNRINSLYSSSQSTDANDLRFLACFFRGYISGTSSSYPYMYYFSFVAPNNSSYSISPRPFIYTNKSSTSRMERLDTAAFIGNPGDSFIVTDGGMCPYFLVDSALLTNGSVFQDVASYYKELGYQDGYSDGYSQGNADGYSAGESAGYASGYSEGLEVGNSNGEANGYANGYAAGLNASNYFKSITANNELVFFDILANITPYYTDGNGNLYYYRIFSAEVGEDFYYCWLCYYSTSNWTQWDVYLVWCDQSSSSGFTLDYLKNHSLGVWGVPKSNGAFSSLQSYAVYNPSIQTLDNAKVSLVYNVQMMQAYVTLDGGRTYGDVYKDGYTTGYHNGYNYGYELGETAGINAAEPEALTNTLVAVFQQPFNQIYRFFNFNILGLNILGLATGLLSVFIIIKVFKKVFK